jgi:hypothetical protein
MSVLDDRQSRPDTNDTGTDDRKDCRDKPDGSAGKLSSYQKYGKKYYEKNKKLCISRSSETKKKQRVTWAAFKETLSCTVCGENHPATLDFHHVVRSPDNKKVHRLVGDGLYKKALEEIKKCVVLCANCHRKHHYEEAKMKKAPHKAGHKSQQEEK